MSVGIILGLVAGIAPYMTGTADNNTNELWRVPDFGIDPAGWEFDPQFCGPRISRSLLLERRRWPRSLKDREARVQRLYEWREKKILEMRKRRLKLAAYLFFGIPVAIAIGAGLWRLAVFMIVD